MTTSPATPDRRPRAKSSPLAGPFARGLAHLWLWFFGWRVEGCLPPSIKAVAIAYPHTTNWDLPFMLAIGYQLGIRPSWLGKREIFRWPFGGFMRWLGGVPVDRNARTNIVGQAIDSFRDVERLFLVVPPSATRHRAAHWRSGFYHIARGAGVPILCTFLDYTRKVGGIGPPVIPSGDVHADMEVIRAFYRGIEGRYPQNQTPIYLPEEDQPISAAAEKSGG